MPVTKAPSVEAAEAIKARLESGGAYTLETPVQYVELFDDRQEVDLRQLRVDVVPETEQQLEETLDLEDRTEHFVRVHIRKRVGKAESTQVPALKLITRQIWQHLNDHKTDRVTIWNVAAESAEVPRKDELRQGNFITSLVVRCEVEASP